MKTDYGYTVNKHGYIQDPGKFEGEPESSVYFWDLLMNGAGDDGWGGKTFFILSTGDKKRFPNLASRYGLAIYETDQGFVQHETFLNLEEYNAAVNA